MPMPNYRAQLQGQGCFIPQLPRHSLEPGRPSTLLAAMSKPAANTEAVRAEFLQAGIPDEVVTKVLQQYPPYLRWPINTKLRPALTVWFQQLGSQQLSERLDKYPQLLHRTPEECNDVFVWLVSIGVDANKIQRTVPRVMTRHLNEAQSTFQATQQAMKLRTEQLPALIMQHPVCLIYSSERVVETLQTVAELLAVSVASMELQVVVLGCGRDLFTSNPVMVRQRVSFFCEEFNGGQHAALAALKTSVYFTSAETMRARAAELKAMLGWTEHELNQNVNADPRILTRQPSTLVNNIQKLQAHNFSPAQAFYIFASCPGVASFDWSSVSMVEKLMFLMLYLQISAAELATKPHLLRASVERKIGPRSEFIHRFKAISPDTPFVQSGFAGYVQYSDAEFAARFNNLSASPPVNYDENFKQHWRQRWVFLTHEMGLSIVDISACRALCFTSLPNVLAPRWRFLNLLENAQADFKAKDHLTALATLSDEHFAQAFNLVDVSLLYDNNFMQFIPSAL